MSLFRCRSALALAGMVAAASGASADVTAKAHYSAALGGWHIGSGNLSFSMDSARSYDASITGGVSGIAALVSSRSASGSAAGRAEGRVTVPRSYGLTVSGGAVTNEVAVRFSGGDVTSVSATELRFATNNERVPLLPQHKVNVVDPLGGFVMSVPRGQDPLASSACNRTVRVFDGRVRYDLRLTYSGSTQIRDTEGYKGPAIVCSVAYRPIAGQRILSEEQQRFERNIEFSITYVPLGDTGVLLPHSVVIGTPMGLLNVVATSFQISGADPLARPADQAIVGSVPAEAAGPRRAKQRKAADAAAVAPAPAAPQPEPVPGTEFSGNNR